MAQSLLWPNLSQLLVLSHKTQQIEVGIDSKHVASGESGVGKACTRARYFTSISRALCGKKRPTAKERREAWNKCAYTIFVQGSVGLGAARRPSHKQFKDAGTHFLALIERVRPLKVIVTGTTLWKNMPKTSVKRRDIEAYKLSDGTLVWCLAVPHPANRTTGFNWKTVGKSIQRFISAKLPLRA